MKIDKRRPGHWLLLLGFAAMGVLGLVLRLFVPRQKRNRVVFYGHRLNGNLWPIYQQLATCTEPGLVPVFLTLDRHDAAKLRVEGVQGIWACSFRTALALAKAKAVITSHGLHSLQYLLTVYQHMGMRFFDVWHGIPYKGFDADDFRLQHRYDEVWVPSPLLKQIYVDRYGFKADKVQVTGYARTDVLVKCNVDTASLKQELGLDGPEVSKIILFAPTWQQDDPQRNIFPFNTDPDIFLAALSEVAQSCAATVVLRAHSSSRNVDTRKFPGIVLRSATDYPLAEPLLQVSDILVCDWSSIAFDWLLLDRPTLFLDVPPPFAKNFSLGPEYRYGAVVASLDVLAQQLTRFVEAPDTYAREYGDRQARIRQRVYGDCADGHAARRCVERTHAALPSR